MIDLKREKLLSVSSAAAMFGVSQSTIYAWFGAGLERVKIGGVVRTSVEAVERFSMLAPVGGQPSQTGDRAAMKRLQEMGVCVG